MGDRETTSDGLDGRATHADADADADDGDRVRAAFASLSPQEHRVLVLRFRDDHGLAQIAEQLGTDRDQVRRHLHHAGWMVEDLAGAATVPAGGWAARPSELVEEEAAAGITPGLAARIRAAVSDGAPPADDHWRWHDLQRSLRRNSASVATALLVLIALVPTVAALTIP